MAILEGLSTAAWPLGDQAVPVEKVMSELGVDGKLDGQKRVKLTPAR
jgi:hypothetical protein